MRRTEDNIRRLCTRLLATKDDQELGPIIVELRDALHYYIDRLRWRLADYPFAVERRVGDAPPLERATGGDAE